MFHLIGVHRSEKLTGIHLSLGSVAPLRLESASVNSARNLTTVFVSVLSRPLPQNNVDAEAGGLPKKSAVHLNFVFGGWGAGGRTQNCS